MGRSRRITKFRVIGLTNAADIDFDIALIVGDREAGDLAIEVIEILQPEQLEVLAADGGGGAGIVLKRLLATVDCNDDHILPAFFFGGGSGAFLGKSSAGLRCQHAD